MSKAMTGSFYLTETVTIPAASPPGTRIQGTIDLGAYINVPTGQAIAIDMVDFIWQSAGAMTQDVASFLVSTGAISGQLTDLNPGTVFIRADDQSLIASGALNCDVINGIASHMSDLYPDSWGPSGLSDMFTVVNDTLYFVAGNDNAAITADNLHVTVRIRARVVKLSSKDWMALALQSTASDS
jgi:hypothetical protein